MKIAICIMACSTIEKYVNEIQTIRDTWAKDCDNNNISYYFFCGENGNSLIKDNNNVVYLKGVNNDYESASYKQWLGIDYILNNHPQYFDYIIITGTDTYLHIKNIMNLLENISPNDKYLIGGHGDYRKINNKIIYFNSGGSGLILTKSALNTIYPLLKDAHQMWKKVMDNTERKDLIYACDVALAYMCYHNNITCIKNDNFFHCNHNGIPCHQGKVNIKTMMSCHLMKRDDMLKVHKDIHFL